MSIDNKKCLVSIIIPIYNVEDYLAECLQSVLIQSYKTLEVICVIDGSTDSSLNIANQFALIDPRISIVEKENGGLSSARNKGLEVASGDYIYFLDSDDWIAPNAIEKLLNPLLMHPNVNISSGGVICYHDHNGTYFPYQTFKRTNGLVKISPANFNCLEMVVWNKLYSKNVFINGRCRFLEGVIHEDEHFYWEVFLKNTNVICIEDDVVYYRKRNNSITTSAKTNRYVDNYVRIVVAVVNLLKERGVFEMYYIPLCNMILKFQSSISKERLSDKDLRNKILEFNINIPLDLRLKRLLLEISSVVDLYVWFRKFSSKLTRQG
ncbi:putative glycosyltransferase [Vibrio cholerae]|nr:putative glycosyltransferase [Vibrio cholerae]GHX80298.1 putative glycosyltransferase [Vibrio cholerae]